jgi:hypothetical protein
MPSTDDGGIRGAGAILLVETPRIAISGWPTEKALNTRFGVLFAISPNCAMSFSRSCHRIAP